MKKYKLHVLIITLIFATLACNLPSRALQDQNSSDDGLVDLEPVDGFRTESRIYDEEVLSISVPQSYYLGQGGSDLESLIGNVDISGLPITVDVQGLFESAQDDILVWGYDGGSTAGIPTSFVVIKNQDYAGIPLGLLSTFAGTLLGNNIEIIEQQRLTIAGRDTLRWITVTYQAGYELTQAVYIFNDSGTLYIVIFNADRQEVSVQLAVYDQIVASLTIEDLN